MNITNLREIAFPVFKLGEKPTVIDDVILNYYEDHTEILNEEEEVDYRVDINYKVIDDKTVPGTSLAHRRLRMKLDGVPLQKLKTAIFFLGDFIKVALPHTWFIDSKGRLFSYVKSTRAILKFYKVEDIIPIQTGGAIICIEGLATRFKTLFMPEQTMKYAGILNIGKSLILYGLYEEQHKDSWRKI